MKLPRVRFTVRRMMMAVALIAAGLGGGLEYSHLKRLSDAYRYRAWAYGGNVQMRLREIATLKPKLAKLKQSPNPDKVEIELLSLAIQGLQSKVAANANLAQIFEHAASHPWETTPEFAEADKDAEKASISKRLSMPTPEPYRPPGT
jgi:hypothetical protein